MKFLTFYILTHALVYGLMGQNLVPNGGFETYHRLPTDEAELLHYARDWHNLNGLAFPPGATPDYFHVRATNKAKLPNTYFGEIQAAEGVACAGFIAYAGWQQDYREYLSIPLTQALQVGKTYEVRWRMALPRAKAYCQGVCNGVGVLLTENRLVQQAAEGLYQYTPQWQAKDILHPTEWQVFSFQLRADKPYRHLTIGNFRRDTQISYAIYLTDGQYKGAYYFIDDISIRLIHPEENQAGVKPHEH